MKTLLQTHRLSKRFGGLHALKDVDLEVTEGEILGLIGPNGAGKTTLLRVVVGVYKPEEGEVVFGGEKITGWSPDKVARRGLSLTHQIVKPLQDMSVLENVMVGACFGRENLTLGKARNVAQEVLGMMGLLERAHAPARELTIAGKRRLELARALAARPKLIMLDEVLAGLNPTEMEWMIQHIQSVRQQGISILMIEHLMQALMSLSDRVMVLNFGEKLAEGRPESVAQDPQVVDAYLGDPNIADKLMGSN
jgi:branched-chain amino acid transport system ATP-binding protein